MVDMMVNSGVTLTNANINSGNPILIPTTGIITCDFTHLLDVFEEDNNIISGTTEWDISEINSIGVKNPIYTINGVFDIDNDSSETIEINGVICDRLTLTLLRKLLVEFDEPTYLHVRIGSTPTFIPKHDGTAVTEITGGGDATNGIKCRIRGGRDSYSIDSESIITGGRGVQVNFTLTLIETS